MSSIDLRIGEMVQGKFELRPLNILLAFQVNCPGCFAHALPLASAIHDQYTKLGIQVLGLSTAFEDFSLNTEENTQKFIKGGYLVGETAKYFQRMGMERYEPRISFPVAMDAKGSDATGQTFSRNCFRGTPTWVIFDSQFQIKATWFGHKEKQEVLQVIDGFVSQESAIQ